MIGGDAGHWSLEDQGAQAEETELSVNYKGPPDIFEDENNIINSMTRCFMFVYET